MQKTSSAFWDRSRGTGAIHEAVAPAIEMQQLTKRFGAFTAVDRLSLTVERGEIFGLLGPNGSGKTTTINMISGLSKPTVGSIRVLGYDIAHEARAVRAALGVVPQETSLYEELTAWTNMTLHADLYRVPRSERNRRIADLLTLVQLSERSHSRVGTFSGGMKRRLALARALLHQPQLVYLDEPTLGVDVETRRGFWGYILDLKATGKTVLLTTNYLEEANMLCDRLAILNHGKLVALDTPTNLKHTYGDIILLIQTASAPSTVLLEQIRSLPSVSKLTQIDLLLKVTVTGDQTVTGQIVWLVTQETDLRSITQREPDLDEIFLHLTGSVLNAKGER